MKSLLAGEVKQLLSKLLEGVNSEAVNYITHKIDKDENETWIENVFLLRNFMRNRPAPPPSLRLIGVEKISGIWTCYSAVHKEGAVHWSFNGQKFSLFYAIFGTKNYTDVIVEVYYDTKTLYYKRGPRWNWSEKELEIIQLFSEIAEKDVLKLNHDEQANFLRSIGLPEEFIECETIIDCILNKN